MFDTREYFKKENSDKDKIYNEKIETIKSILKQTRKKGQEEYWDYFNGIGEIIIRAADIENRVDPDYFSDSSFDDLKKDNEAVFLHRTSPNYENTFADPERAVEKFGQEKGKVLAYFCNDLFRNLSYCFQNKRFAVVENLKRYTALHDAAESGEFSLEKIREILFSDICGIMSEKMERSLDEQFDPSFNLYVDIVNESAKDKTKQIFRYGKYISENEIQMARYLSGYPVEKLEKLASQIMGSYLRSFERSGKSYSGKKYVIVLGAVGLESIMREVLKKTAKEGFKPLFYGMISTDINKQINYDYRFENSLYLDENFVDEIVSSSDGLFSKFKDIFSEVSGLIHVSKFGETPFKPVLKKTAFSLDEKQQELDKKMQAEIMQIRENYLPMSSISFTAISFPSPEIGDNFEEVFSDIIEVNLLDTNKYEKIQKNIIDALDSGVSVHVKGSNDNRTDITIALKPIENPEIQTNFVNCGADMNIPVGEVFTSPVLKGTTGLLHVKEAFLNNLKFTDLELDFEDGYIVSYNCSNFESEEENKKYIKENLLFPHNTLPMGEFAIGTNTLAYVSAKKHGITHLLPVLIIEKMGPHFAIGDTCFFLQEDMKHVNACDGKEMMAKENEKSALRKQDMKKAYCFKHTDITLPFDEIAHIKAVRADSSEIFVIKDGRFVLEGTQELNTVFN
ncbi:aminopeptidase [candidate division WOR-3 bacterium]|nr:aminopeptidase [candidate division WOR-3 bacterium]